MPGRHNAKFNGCKRRAEWSEKRAEIDQRADPQREELPLGVERQRAVENRAPRVIVAEEGFRPGGHPVHRPAGYARGDEQRRVFRIWRVLHSECAADILGDDAQPAAVDAHDAGQAFPQGGNALRADAQGVAIMRRIVDRGRAARLDAGDDDPLVYIRYAGDVRCILDRLFDRARIGVVFAARKTPVDRKIPRRFRP